MATTDLATLQSGILDRYYADNAKKLHKVVGKILVKFGGLSNKDTDDFYSLANEVFVDVMERYDYVQSFDGFLYSCLSNKIMSEITKRNREKRKADRMSTSLDAVNGDNEECSLLEVIPSDFDTFEEAAKAQDIGQYQDKVQLYISKLSNQSIRTDQDRQRLSGQWNANMVGELISMVLTGNYIPPVILGEETVSGITRSWIIDGLQRSSSLSVFRYGNTRITKTVEENLITYQRKVLDGSGNPKRDAKGEIVWETVICDIRNKTYNQLPEELKDRFDGYQIETVNHQDCDTMEISKSVRKFNNHTAMNTNQKAFIYIDNFATDIRRVTENKFFLDIYSGTARAKINGTFERVIADMVLLCNYPDEYRKESKKNFEWLNENASFYDFESIDKLLTKLTDSLEITKEVNALFDVKHAHILIAAFKTFVESGHEAKEF